MRRCIPFAILLFAAQGISGQSLNWHPGAVVLSGGEVTSGEIATSGKDLILFRRQSELTVLPSHAVRLFRYYDEKDNINRQFVSLKVDNRQSRFFEVVVNGDWQVLRRPKFHSPYQIHDEVDGYDYFTWDGQSIEPIRKFKSRVYPKLLELKPMELRAYVEEHHLMVGEMKSAILLIKEFNRIIEEATLVARRR